MRPMVCNLTIDNKKHQDIEGDMKQILARAEDLRHKLTDMIDDAAQKGAALKVYANLKMISDNAYV